MTKQLKKHFSKALICSLISASLIGGVSSHASALTADQLYKNAYDSVVASQQARTQQSINVARSNIKALKGTEAAWSIGEFSQLTDVMQQELFEKFMSYLFSPGGFPKPYVKQVDINSAKTLVFSFDTYEGNKMYTSSWSSAIDTYQQALINDAVNTIVTAEKERKSLFISMAQAQVDSLLTATNNQGVLDYAKALQVRVNAIVPIVDNGGGENPDPSADLMAYNNYVRVNVPADGSLPQMQVKKSDFLGWQPVGAAVSNDHFENYVSYMHSFRDGDYYKGMSAYACVARVYYEFATSTAKENYTDVVRIIDGKVVMRIWEKGKIEEFAPTALTQNQLDKYKVSNYTEMFEAVRVGLNK